MAPRLPDWQSLGGSHAQACQTDDTARSNSANWTLARSSHTAGSWVGGGVGHKPSAAANKPSAAAKSLLRFEDIGSMGIDSVLRRFWFLAVGLFLGLAAYFQADGIGHLLGAAVSSTQLPRNKPKPAISGAIAARPQSKSAAAILSRNPFDSITGPLDGSKPIEFDEVSSPANSDDPYQDPPCSGVKASLITATDDPEWSFASLAGADGKSMLRRKGDSLGSATVNHIGWFPNPPEPPPRVWLNEGGNRCLVQSGAAETSKKPTSSTPPAEKTEPDGKASKSRVPPDLEAKIHKTGENQFSVERSAVNEIIQNYAKLAAGLRTRPTKDGMRLSGIKPNSLLSKLGMKNGDVLKTINGYDMSDQDKALEAYAKLRSSTKLAITVEREKSPQTIDITIK